MGHPFWREAVVKLEEYSFAACEVRFVMQCHFVHEVREYVLKPMMFTFSSWVSGSGPYAFMTTVALSVKMSTRVLDQVILALLCCEMCVARTAWRWRIFFKKPCDRTQPFFSWLGRFRGRLFSSSQCPRTGFSRRRRHRYSEDHTSVRLVNDSIVLRFSQATVFSNRHWFFSLWTASISLIST